MDPVFDHRRVPPAVRQWLLLITASFVAGCELVVLIPSHQALVVQLGVGVNVALAVRTGAALVWQGMPGRLMCAAGLGAVVTVLGWDLLTFTQAEIRGLDGIAVLPLDVFALPIAAVGMTALVGVGAAIGGIGRVLSGRCTCRILQPRFGSSIPT